MAFRWGPTFKLTRLGMRVVVVLTVALAMTCSAFKVGLGEKVDVESPKVAIANPLNGSYVSGPLSLAGSASDDIGLVDSAISVVLTFPESSHLGSRSYSVPVADGAWTLSLDTAAIAPDLELSVKVEATASDAAGNSTLQRIMLYVDNVPPSVRLTVPTESELASADYYLNGSVQFLGSSNPDVADLVLQAGGTEFRTVNSNNASFKI